MSWQNPGKASLSIKQIARVGHFLQQERADEVNALLLDWLDGHEAARRVHGGQSYRVMS